MNALTERMNREVPVDSEDLTVGQQAQWLLATIADRHRREDTSDGWEYFGLSDLSADDPVDERNASSASIRYRSPSIPG